MSTFSPRLTLLKKINDAMPNYRGHTRRDLGRLLTVIDQIITDDEDPANINFFDRQIDGVIAGKSLELPPHLCQPFGISIPIDLAANPPPPASTPPIKGRRRHQRTDTIQRW